MNNLMRETTQLFCCKSASWKLSSDVWSTVTWEVNWKKADWKYIPCMYHFVANQQLIPNAPVLCPLLLNKGGVHSVSPSRGVTVIRGWPLNMQGWCLITEIQQALDTFSPLLVYKVMCQLPLCDQILKVYSDMSFPSKFKFSPKSSHLEIILTHMQAQPPCLPSRDVHASPTISKCGPHWDWQS